MIEKLIDRLFSKCANYYWEAGMEDCDEGCLLDKDINYCGRYFSCYLPKFLQKILYNYRIKMDGDLHPTTNKGQNSADKD